MAVEIEEIVEVQPNEDEESSPKKVDFFVVNLNSQKKEEDIKPFDPQEFDRLVERIHGSFLFIGPQAKYIVVDNSLMVVFSAIFEHREFWERIKESYPQKNELLSAGNINIVRKDDKTVKREIWGSSVSLMDILSFTKSELYRRRGMRPALEEWFEISPDYL